MKKWLSAVLVMCLCCCMLAGCGEKEEGEVEKTEFQTEDMEVDDALEAYSLSIPKDWKCLGGAYAPKKIYVLNDDNGHLHIECTHLRETREMLEEKISGDPTDRLRHLNYSDLELYDKEEVDIDGQQRMLYKFSGKYDDGGEDGAVDGNVQYVSAVWGEGYIELSFFVEKESSFKYNQIFDQILESVSIDMSGEITDEEEHDELTGNILLDTEAEIIDLLSETDEFVGRRILYKLSKSDVQSVSKEQFVEFMDNRVLGISNEVFNYITIDFGDGTGLLCMPGIAVVTYGEIDGTGSIVNQIGVAMLEESGAYSYSQTN